MLDAAKSFLAFLVEYLLYGAAHTCLYVPIEVVERHAEFLRESLADGCLAGSHYDLFLSGSRSLLRIDNPDALWDRTLVVFRDSFGSSIIPLLAESYRTVYAVDIRYLASDRLGRVVEFPDDTDVLFFYSATVLHNSITLK